VFYLKIFLQLFSKYTVRDISYPAVDPQQSAARSRGQDVSPDPLTAQNPQVTQNHVTWDWINDRPMTNHFEMTLAEVTGMADSLTEDDWSEWNLEESSGTFRNTPEGAETQQNLTESADR